MASSEGDSINGNLSHNTNNAKNAERLSFSNNNNNNKTYFRTFSSPIEIICSRSVFNGTRLISGVENSQNAS